MDKIKLLFLCTGNSCRSQMAEGWTKLLKSDVIEAYSAGVEPHPIDPLAVEAMREAGVDISNQRSKHVSELAGVQFDYVITVCGSARDNCPFFPGKVKKIHVGFDDPPALAKSAKSPEEAMRHYRRVRDEIMVYVKSLPDSLREKE